MTTYTSSTYSLRAPNDDELVINGAKAMRDLADDVDTVLAKRSAVIQAGYTAWVPTKNFSYTAFKYLIPITVPLTAGFTSLPSVVVDQAVGSVTDALKWRTFVLELATDHFKVGLVPLETHTSTGAGMFLPWIAVQGMNPARMSSGLTLPALDTTGLTVQDGNSAATHYPA